MGRGLVLVDRNVASKCLSSFASEDQRYWLRFLDSPAVLINPVLCAYEGVRRTRPDLSSFSNELALAGRRLSDAFPNAGMVHFSPSDVSAVYSALDLLHAKYERELNFLGLVCPMVAERKSDALLRKTLESIVHHARESGINPRSLVFLCAVSCLFEDRSGTPLSPARRVLKPKIIYGEGDAHNAISDIRAIEYLAMSAAYGFGEVSVCTLDRQLAVLWRVLKVSVPDPGGVPAVFNLNLGPEFFPRYPSGSSALLHRIDEYFQS